MSDVDGRGPADTDPTGLLGEAGPFAASLPAFRPRPGQQAMARAVDRALIGRSPLVVEAGTGIGKTFAYLVPVLARGLRTIVSTGTKTLQGQLFHRDLPTVQRVLGTRRSTALLKGRANYLCHYRLRRARHGAAGRRAGDPAVLAALRAWAEVTPSGDLGDFPGPGELAPWLPQVTSTAENCLGQECEFYADCFLVRARARAQRADVVVVNHHLLFADLALKREGFGELLPEVDAVIVDEAHRVPETATQFFGRDLSQRMVLDLLRDTLVEAGEVSGAVDAVRPPLDAVDLALKRFRLVLETLPFRCAWDEVVAGAAAGALDEALGALEAVLAELAAATRGLENCWARCGDQRERLALVRAGSSEHVAWFERTERSFTLRLSPLDVADDLRAFRERAPAAWVFTSATLSAGGRFDLFQRRLGLEDAECLTEDSPYDYGHCAALYLPEGLPPPAAPDFVPRLLARVEPVLELTDGRAFLLFTSHRNLRRAADQLRRSGRWRLLVQGEAPRPLLLERFKATPGALLLGAASFWEGVDVVGDALRCVVIDKLPFASPDDPVLQGRVARIREAGGEPFREEQLPHAVLTLKQGVGRLIRGEDDFGLVVLGDPRVKQRAYGRVFLRSLPPMREVRSLHDVRQFLGAHGALTLDL